MRAVQAIKKMVALGVGLTMVGATVFGASAASLADYPAPFVVNGTPASNLAVVVGAQADGSDVVGAVDIIQSLQAQAVVTTAAAGAPSQLVVEGDAVEIGSTSDLLEISEPIGDVRETLTEVDLDMLRGGQIVTDEGSTEFNQYLRFALPGSETTGAAGSLNSSAVVFAEDERDRVGHYLHWEDGRLLFTWELEFEEGLESEVDANGDLVDLEDEDLTILGQPFVIVDTDMVIAGFGTTTNGTTLTSGGNAGTTTDLVIQLIGGAVSAVLGENDKETYVVDGKEYEVEVLVISETSQGGEGSVKFRINGEITDELADGETDVLADGTQIGIRDILATGKDIQKSIVQFYLGAYKVEFRDTNASDQLATVAGAEVNEESIEDSFVVIRGLFTQNARIATSLAGAQFEVQNIRYNLTADAVLGDMFVPPGTGVREHLDEPEGMLTPNWDIRYEGLMDTGVTLVRLDAAGDDEYDLEFTNQEGIFYDFPLASAESGAIGVTAGAGNAVNSLKYGDDDDDLWFTEFNNTFAAPFTTTQSVLRQNQYYITDDDFFVLSNCDVGQDVAGAADNTCFSHVMRYDSFDSTNRQLTFTDLGTGTREVTYDSTTTVADLVVGGVTYRVGVNTTTGNLTADLNGDGDLGGLRGNRTAVVIGIQGEGILNLGVQLNPLLVLNGAGTSGVSYPSFNATGSENISANLLDTWPTGSFNLSLLTLTKEFDEATVNENISINITARTGNEIGIGGVTMTSGGFFSGLLDLEENDNIEQGLSGYGVFFELFDPEGDTEAEDLTIEYPLSQRGARVFVTGGVVTTSAVETGAGQRVQPIQIGAARLDSEVSDVKQFNAIVIGGPCANTVAASLLGSAAEPCHESVAPNKAMLKLFEHTNGNVALLINGRTAQLTRMGARSVATGGLGNVQGMEAEVSGTTFNDVQVRAV
ncbi:hypothetical protein COV18_07205 [Candidatus Woesearchaeota archaeon CG10_big_fil_rev_8_21_14_0_10_37_12]|nr:MAG: hypothetical protein COV18_07205 [Candidatus Woesearchaeota archaeon CG10_big_fil_rev_8_21_14_0_10_37_12]